MGRSKPGQTITLNTDTDIPFECYVAGDANAPAAVLVFHEWWGLKEHNREWARKFAHQGLMVLVIDLYDGRVTSKPDEAGRWMQELDQAAADEKVAAAVRYLADPNRKLAVYGCSMGGKQALRAAMLWPESVRSVAVCYSRMETEVARLRKLQAPVLAIYAEQEKTWPDKQEAFEAAMDAADRETESLSYDAAHGFADPDSDNYDPDVADEALEKAMAFMRRQLTPG